MKVFAATRYFELHPKISSSQFLRNTGASYQLPKVSESSVRQVLDGFIKNEKKTSLFACANMHSTRMRQNSSCAAKPFWLWNVFGWHGTNVTKDKRKMMCVVLLEGTCKFRMWRDKKRVAREIVKNTQWAKLGDRFSCSRCAKSSLICWRMKNLYLRPIPLTKKKKNSGEKRKRTLGAWEHTFLLFAFYFLFMWVYI